MSSANIKKIIPCKKDQLIEMVLDIQKYPEFVPWCIEGKVYEKNESNDFGLVILGENFSKSPKVFEESKKEFVNQIVHWGYVDSFEEYAKWLWKSHIIPVTSNQEFFGVSVMEAMYCDVWPIVPNRLTYPELIPERFHNNNIYNTEEELLKKILWSINNCNGLAQYNIASIPERFDWRSMSKEYDEKLEATL